jgi:hypothetical protein
MTPVTKAVAIDAYLSADIFLGRAIKKDSKKKVGTK